MSRADRAQLLSEQQFLRERLEKLPSSATLTRRSTSSRLLSVEEQLAGLPTLSPSPVMARLTFSGRPVIGSHGIYAEFAMKAVGRFVDAVATVASSLAGPLAAMGPIPNKDRHQLLITGTALGSFGFELEEGPSDQLPLDEESPIARAVGLTQSIFEGSVGTDEELADAATEVDARALGKIREFLTTLAADGAICTLTFREHVSRFRDVGEVQRSANRLSSDNLRERELDIQGSNLSALAMRMQFEMLRAGGTQIYGRVAPSVENVDAINRHTAQAVKVRIMETQVGAGRPRYVLLGVLGWDD
jgi:hypothetical protein